MPRRLKISPKSRGIDIIVDYQYVRHLARWPAFKVPGTLAAAIFFGAFLAVALAGMPSLDAKIAARGSAALGKVCSQHVDLAIRCHCAGSRSFRVL
jgi:hypothetical protein